MSYWDVTDWLCKVGDMRLFALLGENIFILIESIYRIKFDSCMRILSLSLQLNLEEKTLCKFTNSFTTT